MPDIQIEGGEVLANLEERTITGLVLPYNERGRTNVGEFEVQAGVIALPEDPSVVSLNLDHDRYQPAGVGVRFWEVAAGVMGTFRVATGARGDAALAGIADGSRKRLSGEFKTGIKAGRATGGWLAAVGLVARGAFPSAGVLAADAGIDDPTPDATYTDHSETTYTDDQGRTYRRVYDSEATETTTATGTETTTTITVTETEEPAAPAANTEGDQAVTATAIPATHTNGAPTAPAAQVASRGPSLKEVTAAIAGIMNEARGGSPADAESGRAVLAALGDLKTSGANTITVGGATSRPDWVGQLYQGVPYVRQYLPLGTVGTNITLGGKLGYTLGRGTSGAPVNNFAAGWAGDKSDIATGQGFTASAASQLFRFAFGNDIAREFFDLPGGGEVIDAFFRLVLEDHLVWSDMIGLDSWNLAAGAPVAPQAYPAEYNGGAPALGMIIQAILAVNKKKADGRTDQASFIIANELAYQQLMFVAKDKLPEFVTFGPNFDRTGSAGPVGIVVGDTGIQTTPSVVAGSGRAIEFDELPGGPLQIDALEISKGGVDKAIHGYLQRLIVRRQAVVAVGTPDNWAANTVYREGQTVKVGAAVLQVTKANTIPGLSGQSAAAAPTAPGAVGGTVTDGAGATQLTWTRLV